MNEAVASARGFGIIAHKLDLLIGDSHFQPADLLQRCSIVHSTQPEGGGFIDSRTDHSLRWCKPMQLQHDTLTRGCHSVGCT